MQAEGCRKIERAGDRATLPRIKSHVRGARKSEMEAKHSRGRTCHTAPHSRNLSLPHAKSRLAAGSLLNVMQNVLV